VLNRSGGNWRLCRSDLRKVPAFSATRIQEKRRKEKNRSGRRGERPEPFLLGPGVRTGVRLCSASRTRCPLLHRSSCPGSMYVGYQPSTNPGKGKLNSICSMISIFHILGIPLTHLKPHVVGSGPEKPNHLRGRPYYMWA